MALLLAQCTHVRREQPQTVLRPHAGSVRTEGIVGATLKDSSDIRFDKNSRVLVSGDTLRAVVGGRSQAIPVSDLQRVWVQSTDKTRTALTVGAAAALFAIALAWAVITMRD
jgi:hypothetical protein